MATKRLGARVVSAAGLKSQVLQVGGGSGANVGGGGGGTACREKDRKLGGRCVVVGTVMTIGPMSRVAVRCDLEFVESIWLRIMFTNNRAFGLSRAVGGPLAAAAPPPPPPAPTNG